MQGQQLNLSSGKYVRSLTRPERNAKESTLRGRHNTRQARRVVFSSHDEHAAPEECPKPKAQNTERNRDCEFALPHRNAETGSRIKIEAKWSRRRISG